MKGARKNFNRHPPAVRKSQTKQFDTEKNLRLFCDATSQELATVLATVVGELDFALSSISPASKERSMMVAVSAAERALSLARNLRYFSVHTKLNVTVVDLSQILLDTVELIEKELELNEIKITVMAEAGSFVQADPGALQQVIINLLANARKALPKGGQITLSLRQQEKMIEIRCNDTGHGISERELDYVFEPNHTAELGDVAALNRLGLAVSKALVESHGGDLTVQSRVGMGTTVSIHLPFDPKLPKPPPFIEERRFRRVPLNLPVELFLNRGQQTLRTELKTLSIGGCFTLLNDPNPSMLPELNDIVSIRIHYFGDEVFEVPKGRVANVNWAGAQSGIGIEFLELDARAKKLLAAIVKSHST
jgi:hypothetical protein